MNHPNVNPHSGWCRPADGDDTLIGTQPLAAPPVLGQSPDTADDPR